MLSVYEARRGNLRELMKVWGGPTSLAKKLGHSNGSYLAQLAGPNPSREISEKVAREIEATLGLALGWMDSEHSGNTRIDDEALAECVRATTTAVREVKLKLKPDVFGTLVGLVYDHYRLVGRIDEPYIAKLVRLLRG
jgi:hypothetical protein